MLQSFKKLSTAETDFQHIHINMIICVTVDLLSISLTDSNNLSSAATLILYYSICKGGMYTYIYCSFHFSDEAFFEFDGTCECLL